MDVTEEWIAERVGEARTDAELYQVPGSEQWLAEYPPQSFLIWNLADTQDEALEGMLVIYARHLRDCLRGEEAV